MSQALRVLITRPNAQVKNWRNCLREAGFDTDSVPVLSIEPVDVKADRESVKDKILQFNEYQKAIFVSQNAVRYGLEWLDRYWPQLPQGIEYYAIGASTARMLENEGLQVCAGSDAMNSETLLDILQDQIDTNDKVLIFRGKGGRTHLGDALMERGCNLDYCELYHRLLPEQAAEELAALEQTPDIISVHSGESLFNLNLLLEQCQLNHWRHQQLLVPGTRLQNLAHERGFKNVIVADNATDNAMLKALQSWQKEHQSVPA